MEKEDKGTLFKSYKFQPRKGYFAIFSGEDFQSINEFAEDEKWEQNRDNSIKRFSRNGVLKHFLNRTFSRLKYENKIEYSSCGKYACFNTGLLTKEKKDVFLFFGLAPEGDMWHFKYPIDSYAVELQHFDRTPEMVNFTHSCESLFFDMSYDLEINIEHIAEENIDRLPEIFKGQPTLASHAIVGAVEELKIRLKRDYSLAVASYYQGIVQLFLPIDLLGNGNGMVALVADKDEDRKIYRIRTVLPIEVAYGNARVLRRLDGDWLKI